MIRPARKRRMGQMVALADILANGVAILMLLIVLSIKIQSDQAREEINQNADITTILSRDMAKTIIYNDLPSSPPAVLHDYHSCLVPHDCNESLYPIIEIHDDFVRLKNENVRISLVEMLKRPNPLDSWLSAHSDLEKFNIRVDIYGVGAYYLALSILSENGINHPRHWHFLEKRGTPGSGDGLGSEDFIAKYEEDNPFGDALNGGLNGDGEESGDAGEEDGGGMEPLPMDEFGDITMIQGGSFSDLAARGVIGGSPNGEGTQGRGESEMQIKSRMSEGRFGSIGIGLPNMPMAFASMSGDSPAHLSSIEYMIFAALFLLHYGHELQGFHVPYLQDTLKLFNKRPRHIRANSNYAYLPEVSDLLQISLAQEDAWPEYFAEEFTNDVGQVGLSGAQASFINSFVYHKMSERSALTEGISVLLRPWPSSYQGERTEVTDSLVLAHPKHLHEVEPGLRWLPLAFLTPVEDSLHINLGFVMADFRDDRIFIPTDLNQVWTRSGPMRAVRQDVDVRPSLLRLLLIYSLPALLFISAILWIYYRISRKRARAEQLLGHS